MSNQQKPYSYYYLTITGEGDAHRLVKEYHLGNASAWNKGDIEQDRYQFEQMCIRIESYYSDDEDLYEHEFIMRFLTQPNTIGLNVLPHCFERTVHIVRHGTDFQGYGFSLSSDAIQLLARARLQVQYHGYKQIDDGLDFPFAKNIPENRDYSCLFSECAYFRIISGHHTLEDLAAITGFDFNVERSKQQRSLRFKKRVVEQGEFPKRWPNTHFVIDSGIDKGKPIIEHIEALMTKIMANYERLIPLILDYQVEFYLVGTGHLSMPYQLTLSSEVIVNLAKLRASIDMDLYAQ